GLIAADVSNQSITISSNLASFVNEGVVRAENNGTVNLDANVQTSDLGMLIADGGRVNLRGVVENAGSVLTLDGGTGSWFLDGGRINGGVLNLEKGATLRPTANGNNRLAGVLVNGDLVLDQNSAQLRFNDGLTVNGRVILSGSGASLTSTSVDGQLESAELVLSPGAVLFASGGTTLTLGEGVVVRGGNATIGRTGSGDAFLVNRGLIAADVSNQSITISSNLASFVNEGTVRAENGSTVSVQPASWSNSGILDIRGGGLLSASTLNQSSAGSVQVELAGTSPSQYGRLQISGAASLAGGFTATIADGFGPAVGNTFDPITFGSRSGEFESIILPDLKGAGLFDLLYQSDRVRLQVLAP
ncbi:MAG: hypothetical protein ACNA8P_11355, partial [Phycisphaerales bacterium]